LLVEAGIGDRQQLRLAAVFYDVQPELQPIETIDEDMYKS
jgi:hypothetical protein